MTLVEHLDRFAVLRQVLPQDRYGDDEVAEIVDRCCELAFREGTVLAEVGQPAEDWFVVLDGAVEVTEPGRTWTACSGAIVQPCVGARPGVAALRVVTVMSTIVLQLAADGTEGRQ